MGPPSTISGRAPGDRDARVVITAGTMVRGTPAHPLFLSSAPVLLRRLDQSFRHGVVARRGPVVPAVRRSAGARSGAGADRGVARAFRAQHFLLPIGGL